MDGVGMALSNSVKNDHRPENHGTIGVLKTTLILVCEGNEMGHGRKDMTADVKLLHQRKGFLTRLRDERYLQAMALMGVIWMIIFCYVPMYGIIVAFKENYRVTQKMFSLDFLTSGWARNFGFQHFIAFFEDPECLNVFVNTLGISLLKLCICFPAPILFALLMNEVRFPRFKKTVQTISYLPHFLSWVVLGGILTTWLDASGLFNELLIKAGILDEGIHFLAYPKYFWAISVLSDLWKDLGWNTILYLASITAIDPSLYEAAKVDGANRWQMMTKITLPSIKSTVVIMLILNVGGLFNSNFDQIFVLWNTLNQPRSNVIDIYTYHAAMSYGRYSYAAAIGLFKSVISFILLYLTNKLTKKINDVSLF